MCILRYVELKGIKEIGNYDECDRNSKNRFLTCSLKTPLLIMWKKHRATLLLIQSNQQRPKTGIMLMNMGGPETTDEVFGQKYSFLLHGKIISYLNYLGHFDISILTS